MSRGVGEAGILLEYITREDAGDIVCEASNGVGHDTARDVLALDVLACCRKSWRKASFPRVMITGKQEPAKDAHPGHWKGRSGWTALGRC